MKFSNYERRQGEMSIRNLSDKAKAVYNAMDFVEVYQREDKFYVRGILEADDMTFEEFDEFFCEIAAALNIN
jgi:hypothetical protein